MSRLRGRAAAAFMALLLALYLVASVILGVGYLSAGQPIATVMGVALLVLPLVGAWALWRELRFGVRSERLLGTLAEAGRLPELPPAATGPEFRAQAAALLPELEAATAANADWQDWLRLGVVLDAAGKRSEARAAVRTAIKLAN